MDSCYLFRYMCHASSIQNLKFCICHDKDLERFLDLIADPLSLTLTKGRHGDVSIEGCASLVT